MRCKKLWMVLVAIVMIAAPLRSDLFRVGPGEPYLKIMQAIDLASDGDTISVKSGTESDPLVYEEQIDFMGKDILVAAREVGATSPYQIDSPNPLATVIKLPDTLASSDEASVVYFRNGESQNAELRGFTITNGRGTVRETWVYNPLSRTFLKEFAQVGGGIYINRSNPVIKKCMIRDNIVEGVNLYSTGGGIFCDSASPTITHSEIRDNMVIARGIKSSHGGGIAISYYASPLIEFCQILSNQALCDSTAGSIGGGIFCEYASSPRIYSNTIRNNYAESGGGGLFFIEFTQVDPPLSRPELKRNYITDNYVGSATPWQYGGGGIYTEDCNLIAGNNMFGRNHCQSVGGGVTICAYRSGVEILLINNTIYRNRAPDAAGFYVFNPSGTSTDVTIYFKNNAVVWNDTGGIFVRDPVTIYNDYNCWYGNVEYNYINMPPGGHDISANPHMDANYHLTPASHLIDAGDNCAWSFCPSYDIDFMPNADIDGEARFAAGNHDSTYRIVVDIGADEYPGPVLYCGDENLNGSINVIDVTYLFIHLLPNPSICPYYLGDVNGDCSVDVTDAAYLFANLLPAPHDLHCPTRDICEPLPGTLGDGLAKISMSTIKSVDDRVYEIEILLDNGEPVVGTQFEIQYNPEKWEVLGAYSAGRAADFDLTEGFEYGSYSFAQLCPFNRFQKGLASGSGPIARIELNWIGNGQPDVSDIKITKAIVVNTQGHKMLVDIISNSSAMLANKEKEIPNVFGITEIIPNPFSGRTSIKFAIPKSTKITLSVYNDAGQKVRTLINEKLMPGYYTVMWNGSDERGKSLPVGVYFLIMKGGGHKTVKKLTILR